MRLNINTSLTNGRVPNGARKSPDEAKRTPVKFLLGNRIYACPRTTLSKYPDSHLAKLAGAASARSTPPPVDLWELNRSGELFEMVLKLMECHQDAKKSNGRVNHLPMDLSDPQMKANLLKELSYYNLPCLAKLVQ